LRDRKGHQNEDEQCTYHKYLHLLNRIKLCRKVTGVAVTQTT
jgi:hypothetical protein